MDCSHIFLCFFLFLPTLSTVQSCSITKCINDNFAIRFPFRIPDQQPARCGYPGFNIACNKAGVATLNLSSSERFFVRNIDYATQQIQLYDPDACFPRRLLQGFKLNLSSPFMPLFSQNFTFLSCPPQFAMSHYPIIDCLSNATNSVLATSSMSIVKSMSTSCKNITTLPVPVSYLDGNSQFLSNLNEDLVLTWYSPACSICETEGRLCGYKSSTGQGIACFKKYATGKTFALCYYLLTLCLSLNYISHKAQNIILWNWWERISLTSPVYHSWLRKSLKQIRDEISKEQTEKKPNNYFFIS